MKNLILLIVIFNLTFCKSSVKPDKQQLLEADRMFSATSVTQGYNLAFIEFAHPDAVLLRQNNMPVVGKEAVKLLFEKADTTGIDFTWEPIAGNIASSGELGYTYGIYTFKKDTVSEKGTYVSIWKKDSKGNWKYILDCGNKGIKEPETDKNN